jgi:hypothetical protein
MEVEVLRNECGWAERMKVCSSRRDGSVQLQLQVNQIVQCFCAQVVYGVLGGHGHFVGVGSLPAQKSLPGLGQPAR